MYRFSLLFGLFAAPLLGCGGEAPSSCATMCSAGADRWEACDLPDADEWQLSCDTWAWEIIIGSWCANGCLPVSAWKSRAVSE